MKSRKITSTNHNDTISSPDDVVIVRGAHYNQLKDDWDAHITADGVGKLDTLGEYTSGSGVTISHANGVERKTATVTLSPSVIVGTGAGMIGSTAGAELVAAPGSGSVLQLLGAVLVYDHATAAYTAGADDTAIQNGDSAVVLTPVIAGADLLEATGDKMVQLVPLSASDQALTANKPLTLKGTALTQPGTAAGVLRVIVDYNIITTGL